MVRLSGLDLVGKEPMKGVSFTCKVNFDPGNYDPEGWLHSAEYRKDDWAKKIRLRRHIGDFAEWKDHAKYKIAFERLLKDLKPR
jgi:hypothetical protein